jgi:DNA polymerase-3 subunit beta
VKLVSRLINGKYPEYKHIMPANYETKIIGDKQVLQNAIRMGNIFSSAGTNEISLKIDQEEEKIFILSSGVETGENSTELKFEIQGPSQEVIFNAKYLLDGINIISSDKVVISINNKSTPVAVQEFDEKAGVILNDFIYIVMPVKN